MERVGSASPELTKPFRDKRPGAIVPSLGLFDLRVARVLQQGAASAKATRSVHTLVSGVR